MPRRIGRGQQGGQRKGQPARKRSARGRAGSKISPRAASLPASPAAAIGQRGPEAIWTGTISFSLVAIPVQLVTASGAGRTSFRLLHSKDHSPLVRRMMCPTEGKIVPDEEIVLGYEIGQDKYVEVTDRELESVTPERSRTIEIIQFIDAAEIDSVYYDRPYYLVPTKGGEKAYRLLVEVMDRTGRAGLAKLVLGEREYLVAVKSTGGALSLITLHYSEDILPDEDVAPGGEKIPAVDRERIRRAVQAMASDFHPAKYADLRHRKIIALIKKKARAKGTVEAPAVAEEEAEGPVDLVAVLERSMRKAKRK